MMLWFGSNISCAIARLTSGPHGPPSVELTIRFWTIRESRSIEPARLTCRTCLPDQSAGGRGRGNTRRSLASELVGTVVLVKDPAVSEMGRLDDAMDIRQRMLDAIVQDNPVSQDYREFHHSNGKEIGPTFPQVDYIFFEPPINGSSWGDLSAYPPQEAFSGRVILKRSAKVTDLLSCWEAGWGLLMSNRAWDIFQRFDLGNHKEYPITCEHRGGTQEFHFVAIRNELLEVIAFDRSVFYASNVFRAHMYDVVFASRSEYDKRIEELLSGKHQKVGYRDGLVENDVEPKRLFVAAEHQHLDVVNWYGRYHFSLRLADVIAAEGLTGLELRESRKLFGAAGTKTAT